MSDVGLAGLEESIVKKLRVEGPQDVVDLVVDLAQPPSLVLSALTHLQRAGTVEAAEINGRTLYQTPLTVPFARS